MVSLQDPVRTRKTSLEKIKSFHLSYKFGFCLYRAEMTSHRLHTALNTLKEFPASSYFQVFNIVLAAFCQVQSGNSEPMSINKAQLLKRVRHKCSKLRNHNRKLMLTLQTKETPSSPMMKAQHIQLFTFQ